MSFNTNSTTITPTSNTLFEDLFEHRLAEIEPTLIRRVNYRMDRHDSMTRDDALQMVRIALWEKFSADPEYWMAESTEHWRRYAHGCLKIAMFQAPYNGGSRTRKYHEMQGTDVVGMFRTEEEVTIDEAISVLATRKTSKKNTRARDRDMLLAELRIDLAAAIQRSLDRLYDDAQRRDLLLLIEGIMDGYIQKEIVERNGWTRNRGIKMTRKLRTIIYEEFTGKEKTGYRGHNHPLTEDEITKIKELRASGLSAKKIAKKIGRAKGSVEAFIINYPPEKIAQVHQLRRSGLSQRAIAKQIDRSASWVHWLLQANPLPPEPVSHDAEGDELLQFAIEELGAVIIKSFEADDSSRDSTDTTTIKYTPQQPAGEYADAAR